MKKSLEEYSNMEVLLVGMIASACSHDTDPDAVLTQFTITGQASIAGGVESVGASKAEESVNAAILKAQKKITETRERTQISIFEE